LATGTAELDGAASLNERLPERATFVADKKYDAEAFVEALKALAIKPEVAITGPVIKNGVARKTTVPNEDAASLRYAISQRLRKRIDECFG
jgi:hypothetical protein